MPEPPMLPAFNVLDGFMLLDVTLGILVIMLEVLLSEVVNVMTEDVSIPPLPAPIPPSPPLPELPLLGAMVVLVTVLV